MADETITGTDQAEVLAGASFDELIKALAGDDVVVAGGGNDIVSGGDGDDVLVGEEGNDILFGDRGNDIMLGGTGNDRMVWNNGDGSDIMEGGDGYDTAKANGSDTLGDEFTIGFSDGRVDFQRVNFGQFSLDIGSTESLVVNGLGGDDLINASALDADLIKLNVYGGDGNDTILGSQGADVLSGGDGNDVLIGNRGNDVMRGGNGNDRMVWNNGDGSDVMDGDAGYDTVTVNGADTAGDAFEVSYASGAVHFERTNLGPFALEIKDTEKLVINGQGGDDTIDASALDAGLIRLNVTGGEGNDRILGSQGADYLNGGNGNDVLIGNRGNDVMRGGNGNDRMVWNNGDGSDVMDGDAGYDTVVVNGADTAGDAFEVSYASGAVHFERTNLGPFALEIKDTEQLVIKGQGGDDLINASALDADLIKLNVYGGDGYDTVLGSQGVDVLSGGDGNDVLIGNRGNDVLRGGNGNDRMVWNNGDGSDIMDGDAGYDTITVNGADTAGDAFEVSSASGAVHFERTNLGPFALDIRDSEKLVVNGQGGGDTIDASELEAGVIKLRAFGGEGNDEIIGGAGDDQLYGGAGNDELEGERGNDSMYGGAGNDTLEWDNGDGSDLMEGGAGYDTVEVEGAVDQGDSFTIKTNGDRVDFARTNLGQFTLDIGSSEKLEVDGAGGDDAIDASGLEVGQIRLRLDGGEGNDTIQGSQGADYINGGEGDDFMTGEAGADVFVFQQGADVITDFEDGIDRIRIANVDGYDEYSNVQAVISQQDDDVVIDFGDHNTLTIEDTWIGNIDSSDFLF